MTRLIIGFSVIFIFIDQLHSQTPSATIKFEERVYSFGTILEKNGKVSHTFIFQNNGTTPAVINDVYSGCGCIGKVHSNDPVKPGATGKIKVTFDPAYKSGFFSKEIVVYSNNGQNYNRIWVEGNITATEHPIEDDYPYNFGNGLYLRLKVMAFGYVKPGETRQMELHYANATDKEMTLNFAVRGTEGGLTFTNPGKIGPKAKGVVLFSYTMPAVSKDDVLLTVYPYVNNKKLTETLEIKILNQKKLSQKQNLNSQIRFQK
jgi:hypothetical protein